MRRRDAAELLLLGALWGASFLFMRLSTAEFGPFALVFVRVAGAALLMLPLLLRAGDAAALRRHAPTIALVGLVSTAVPFVLFAAAALVLGAGLMSVFNATAPIWGALVAWLWLGERLGAVRVAGLALGIGGVVGLTWGQADLRAGAESSSPAWAMAACTGAAVFYGVGANISRRYLDGVPPMAVAAGSQLAAAVLLAPPALWAWPSRWPGATAWAAAAALAVACTAMAYVLYFRLIANAGATNAISVAFLIPGFAMLWAWLFLGEIPTGRMLAGCAAILVGTALSTGFVGARRPAPAAGRPAA